MSENHGFFDDFREEEKFRSSHRMCFLKTQEIPVLESLLNKIADLQAWNLKWDFNTGVFLLILQNF